MWITSSVVRTFEQLLFGQVQNNLPTHFFRFLTDSANPERRKTEHCTISFPKKDVCISFLFSIHFGVFCLRFFMWWYWCTGTNHYKKWYLINFSPCTQMNNGVKVTFLLFFLHNSFQFFFVFATIMFFPNFLITEIMRKSM